MVPQVLEKPQDVVLHRIIEDERRDLDTYRAKIGGPLRVLDGAQRVLVVDVAHDRSLILGCLRHRI